MNIRWSWRVTANKAEVEKAMAAVKSGDYASALTSLKQAGASVNVTPEQKQAIQDLIAQVQAKLGAAASDVVDKAKAAGGDAAKQAGDLQKAVGK